MIAGELADKRFSKALERYGAVFNGTHDDSDAIQAAIDALAGATTSTAPNNRKQPITLPAVSEIGGAQIKVNKSLALDVSRLGHINLNGNVLDFSGLPDGDDAFTLTGTAASGMALYRQSLFCLMNGSLLGNGMGGTSRALNLTAGSGLAGANHVTFKDLLISQFGDVYVLGTNCYIVRSRNVGMYYCGRSIYVPSGSNRGEQLSFVQCVIANGTNAIQCDDPETDINLLHCSIDYMSGFWVSQSGGKVSIIDANLEGSADAVQFVLTGGCTTVQGGRMLNAGSTRDNEVANVGATAEFHLRDVWRHNYTFSDPAAKPFIVGSGRWSVRDPLGYSNPLSTNLLSNDEGSNILVDGGFERASVSADPDATLLLDNYIITGDGTLTPRDRYRGTNLQLLVADNTTPGTTRTGSRCLDVLIAGGNGVNRKFALYAVLPERGEGRYALRWADKLSAGSGTYNVYARWCDGFVAGPRVIGRYTGAIDWASMATGEFAVMGPYTVTGARLGDAVVVSPARGGSAGLNPAGVVFDGYVSANDTVYVTAHNRSGTTQDLASSAFSLYVERGVDLPVPRAFAASDAASYGPLTPTSSYSVRYGPPSSTMGLRPPKWASHLRLEFDLTSINSNGNHFYLDDVMVQRVG